MRAMVQALRARAPRERKLALIRAHPDLAGRLAVTELTAEFTGRAILRRPRQPHPGEREPFLALNDPYKDKFGFPFIMAVKGRSKDEILPPSRSGSDTSRRRNSSAPFPRLSGSRYSRLKERLP